MPDTKQGFTLAGFFSHLRYDSIFCNIKRSAYVSDSSVFESLFFDLLFSCVTRYIHAALRVMPFIVVSW
jgi:hypothetical protein